LLTIGRRIGESFWISSSLSFTLSLTWGESRSAPRLKTPEIDNPAATLG
jgi:hypothetical protein